LRSSNWQCPGKDDHPAAGRDRAIHMREAVRLDAPGSKTRMRVFGRDAAEIVPHVGDDAPGLGLRKLGKGAADVAPSMFGDA